jgi:hypothetical protein
LRKTQFFSPNFSAKIEKHNPYIGPRYLFFAGCSGIVAVAIRILMFIVEKNLARASNKICA